MYAIAFSRAPTRSELESNVAFLKKQRGSETAGSSSLSQDKASLAALTDLAHVTLNLNEFAYIQ
jgi:hypothetical protein